MCGVHHDIIDDDEQSYTVERLHEIKTTHVQKASTLPEDETDRGALVLLSTPVISVNQSGGITASLVTVNNFGLVGQNDQEKSTAKPSSRVAQPQEGDARFRKSAAPLGMSWNSYTRSNQQQVDVRLAEGKAVWLRLIPVDLSEREFGPLDLKNAATRGNVCLLPLAALDVDFLIAEDGFGICNKVDYSQGSVTCGVAFAFVTGEVWSIDTQLLNFDDKIYIDEIARHLVSRLPDYAQFLNNLDIKAPYHWIAGIEGVSRMKLAYDGQGSLSQYFGGAVCMSNTVAEGALYDGNEDASAALAPLLGKIFKKSGVACPTRYQNRAK
jgi:hypothetical protein